MRHAYSLTPLGVTLITAFMLVSSVLIVSDPAFAEPPRKAQPCACPDTGSTPHKPTPRPRLADLPLDHSDEAAALEAVQVALSEVGDGASYVWYRRNGRLSGVVHPTNSFKDGAGNVCRHIVLVLASGSYSRRTEGIACRAASGVWQLEG
jgi:hypothetical protein